MAFSALKPCSRIMRGSPNQSDQQEKEAHDLLLLQEEHAEEEDQEEEEASLRKSFNCEPPPSKHEPNSISSNSSGLTSDSSSPPAQLPTFIAPQGLHSLQLPLRKECRKSRPTKDDCNGRHLVPRCEEAAFTHSFHDVSVPMSDFGQHRRRSSIRSMLQSKPRKPNLELHGNVTQKLHSQKGCGGTNGSVYGLVLDQTMSMHEPGGEKKRHSSACARDMISRNDVAMLKSRFRDVEPCSWEEEVRQAMAKSSLSRRPNNVDCKGRTVAGGLQRSTSGREQLCGISALPSTLIVKRADNLGCVDAAAMCTEETIGAKLIQDTKVSGRVHPPSRGVTDEERMWRGFNVVKSPSEERWEEAAADEERQEMRRRARSQSLRYDSRLRASDLAGFSKTDATNVLYNEEPDWAVYTRSGYVSVRPRKGDADVHSACCTSLMGRSSSMRETRMGLVMECAACGTTLHGAGGQLVCFCSCCAAGRSSTLQGTPSAQRKKGAGSGILRACRRLLGLVKKPPGNR